MADIAFVAFALRQNDLRLLDILIRDLAEQMRDAVQPCALLIVTVHDPPPRFRDVGTLEHFFLGGSIILPAPTRFKIHRRQLPLLERIVNTHVEAEFLLLVADRKPILDEDDPRSHQHPLKLGYIVEKLFDLHRRCKAHHPLDSGTIIPAPVEENDLAGCREMRDIALEIPLRPLTLIGRWQCDDARDARVQALGDALDGAALAGGIPAFEQYQDLQPLGLDPGLQAHQLVLQPEQLLEIDLPCQCLLLWVGGHVAQQPSKPLVVELDFEFLVETIGHFGFDPRQHGGVFGIIVGHVILTGLRKSGEIGSQRPLRKNPRR